MSSVNATAPAPAASSPAPAPSSAAPPAVSSAAPAPAPSSQAPAPAPAPASSSNPPANSPSPNPPAQSSAAPAPASPSQANGDTTQVVTAPTAAPTATEVQTSIVVITPAVTRPGETPSVIVITNVITHTNANANTQQTIAPTAASSARPSSSNGTELTGAQSDNSTGLSTGGKTAIAVVIPVVVVALLLLGGIFFWRKRKQRKNNEDERRKEVEEYGYNPNHDPTLPAVGGLAMAEDESGYRGWGNTTTSSNRKASTTLTSGMTYSDSNSNPGGYASPNSPTQGAYSDANSDNPLVNSKRETLDSDGIGALGVVNGAAASNSANNQTGVHRGPSNASSSYSAGNHSDNSGEYPGMPINNPQEYYEQGYYQTGPYASNDPYTAQHQPIIRDVSARRNTRIENPSVFPQQGNSGIAQNF